MGKNLTNILGNRTRALSSKISLIKTACVAIFHGLSVVLVFLGLCVLFIIAACCHCSALLWFIIGKRLQLSLMLLLLIVFASLLVVAIPSIWVVPKKLIVYMNMCLVILCIVLITVIKSHLNVVQVVALIENNFKYHLKKGEFDDSQYAFHVWNILQSEYKCCGIYNYTDWLSELSSVGNKSLASFGEFSVPRSCYESQSNQDDLSSRITSTPPFKIGCLFYVLKIVNFLIPLGQTFCTFVLANLGFYLVAHAIILLQNKLSTEQINECD